MAAQACAAADGVEESTIVPPGTPMRTSAVVATDDEALADDRVASTPVRTRVRGRPSGRPKIDIDAEVDEANRLAELFKRMQHASKIAAKCAMKSKQRLMKKANALSQQDLMRLAVLKRCGFIEPTDSCSEAPATPALSVMQPGTKLSTTSGGTVGKKLQGLVSSIPGASELVKALDVSGNGLCPAAAAAASCTSRCSRSASSACLPRQPVGLKRLPSCPSVDAIGRHKAPRREAIEEAPQKHAAKAGEKESNGLVVSEGEE